MISGSDGHWTPPDFSKYGKVKFYTDNSSAHRRPGKFDALHDHYLVIAVEETAVEAFTHSTVV